MTRKSAKINILAGTLACLIGSSTPSFSAPVVQKSLEGPGQHAVVNLKGGVESINDQGGIRLEGDATFYSQDRRAALRIDAANLNSTKRRELTRALVTLGFKLPDENRLLISGGTLSRWHEDSFGDGVGTRGDRIDQSVVGLTLTHRVSPLTAARLRKTTSSCSKATALAEAPRPTSFWALKPTVKRETSKSEPVFREKSLLNSSATTHHGSFRPKPASRGLSTPQRAARQP